MQFSFFEQVFVEAFQSALEDCLAAVHTRATLGVRGKIERVVSHWARKQVFPTPFLARVGTTLDMPGTWLHLFVLFCLIVLICFDCFLLHWHAALHIQLSQLSPFCSYDR